MKKKKKKHSVFAPQFLTVVLFQIFFCHDGTRACIILKCLSIGTPKTINFPFAANGKLMVFMCPNIHHIIMKL